MSGMEDLIAELEPEVTTTDTNETTETVAEVVTTPENVIEGNSGNSATTEVVTPVSTETTAQPETNAQPVQDSGQAQPDPVFDWEKVSGLSEGLVRDEESFGQIIERAKRFDDLSKEAETLKEAQPANEFVSKLNGLVKSGAGKEQISAFLKVNEVDLTSIDPKEALIQRAILIEGKSRRLAEFEFNASYDLNSHDEESDEYLAIQEKISYDGSKASKELESYKGEMSTFINKESQDAENERLRQVAETEKYNSLIKQEAPKIASKFDSKMVINDGEKDHEIPFSDDFKKRMPDVVENFFKTSRKPVNEETLSELATHLEHVYFASNRDAIFKDMRNKIASEVEEKLANKYENRGGLNPDVQNPNSFSGGYTDDSAFEAAKILGLDNY